MAIKTIESSAREKTRRGRTANVNTELLADLKAVNGGKIPPVTQTLLLDHFGTVPVDKRSSTSNVIRSHWKMAFATKANPDPKVQIEYPPTGVIQVTAKAPAKA